MLNETSFSCAQSIKMDKHSNIKFIRKYYPVFLLFNFFSLSPTKSRTCTNNIFCGIIFSGLFTEIIYFTLKYVNIETKKDFTFFVAIFLILWAHLISIVEAKMFIKNQIKTLNSFECIDGLLKKSLNIFIDYKKSQRKHTVIVWSLCLFILFCQSLGNSLTYKSSVDIDWVSGITFSKIVICIKIVQVIFYVRMINERIALLCVGVKSLKNCKDIKLIVQSLVTIKDIYNRIWIGTVNLSLTHGYSLAVILIYGFFDIIHNIYSILEINSVEFNMKMTTGNNIKKLLS